MTHRGNLASGTTDGPGSAARARNLERRYLERLSVPWWMWLPTVAIVALLGAEIGLGAAGPRTWLPPLILLPLSLAGLWWLGRIRLAVTDSELVADDARLPLAFVAEVIPLTGEDVRLLLGPGADPLAFVIQRPWVKGGVQILLNDPADPTPYWILSTRSPEKLAAALN